MPSLEGGTDQREMHTFSLNNSSEYLSVGVQVNRPEHQNYFVCKILINKWL